jgi:hypothetical protein
VPIPLTVSIAPRTTRNGEGAVKLFVDVAYFPQSLLRVDNCPTTLKYQVYSLSVAI